MVRTGVLGGPRGWGGVILGVLGLVGGARCGGGQSGDPGVKTGPSVGEPVAVDCSLTTWDPSDNGPKHHRCDVADPKARRFDSDGVMLQVDWDCDCSGVPQMARAQLCNEALQQGCGVDSLAANYCTYELGTCFPEGPANQWLCRCGANAPRSNAELSGVVATACEEAVLACGSNCNNEYGNCESDVDYPSRQVCACAPPVTSFQTIASDIYQNNSAIGRGRVVYENLSCERALGTACGLSCQQPTMGGCQYDGSEGFDCECENAENVRVDFASLSQRGRVPDCDGALRLACDTLQLDADCYSTSGTKFGQCQSRPELGGPDASAAAPSFNCTCSDDAALDEARSYTVETDDCGQALRESCPEAIRTPTNEGSSDLGQLCEGDDDCIHAKCYVPGTRQDAICSKACSNDADCPDAARCVNVGNQDVCMLRCNDDAACIGLNDALYNPLHCSDDFGPGDSVCVQSSEP